MMKQLTIVHTESHRQWSGQEMRVFHEARWMVEQGHRVAILAPDSCPLYEKASQAGLDTYAVPFTKSSLVNDYFQVRRLLKEIQPDVLNTHGNMDAKVVLTGARGLNIPCVIRSRHYLAPVKKSFYNRLLYGPLCHYVFTTGEMTSRQLIDDLDLPSAKVVTMSSGIVPPDQLDERLPARKELCKELGVDAQSRFVGYLGRIAEDKGLLDLVDAFAAIHQQYSHLHLVMVGEGDLAEQLKGKAAEFGVKQKVHLTGFKNNPWSWLRALDCYVQASNRSEGIPQAIMQAMYAKTPVIGTNIGGIPDVVLPEKTGLLIEPNNPVELAEAIREIISKPDMAQQRVDAAYQMICDKHLLDIMGQKTLAIYAEKIEELKAI